MVRLNDGGEVTEDTYKLLENRYKGGAKSVKITRRIKTTGSIVRTRAINGTLFQDNYYKLYTIGEYDLTVLFGDSNETY